MRVLDFRSFGKLTGCTLCERLESKRAVQLHDFSTPFGLPLFVIPEFILVYVSQQLIGRRDTPCDTFLRRRAPRAASQGGIAAAH